LKLSEQIRIEREFTRSDAASNHDSVGLVRERHRPLSGDDNTVLPIGFAPANPNIVSCLAPDTDPSGTHNIIAAGNEIGASLWRIERS
jgi:hypothetical protein